MNAKADETAGRDDAKPFLEHLEDLRRALIRCAAALVAGMIVAFPSAPWILRVLQRPLRSVVEDPERFLRSLEVGGAFSVAMRMAFWSGLLISAPFLLLFVGQFVFPGLKRGERKLVLQAGAFGVALFVVGVALGYWVTLPAALRVMFGMHAWLGISAEWTITSYVAFTSQLLIGFGLAFELPAVLLVLARLGLVSHGQLQVARPYAVVIGLVVAALLTPPDVISQLIMAVPLLLLYELCVWITWAGERRKAAAGMQELTPRAPAGRP